MHALQDLYKAIPPSAGKEPYFIPVRWNYLSVPGRKDPARPNEIAVDPCAFYRACLAFILDAPQAPPKQSGCGVLYSMLPRAFSAWNHTGSLQSGSFLKCIALLPLLMQMGVDILYLLPVFRSSRAFQKGNAPSPYSIEDMEAFDPDLDDPFAGGLPLARQFAALVEACHQLGLRVMLDFVFRTAARDHVFVREHPDWFYWIKAELAQSLAAPGVKGLGHAVVSPDNVDLLYASDEMPAFLDGFVPPPDPEAWRTLCRRADETGKNCMDLAIREWGICTLPGFADTINDPQPPWTDVTYLKFYFDPSPAAKALPDLDARPPFIAQDGVKCSVFPGKEPNVGLWDKVAGIIPAFIRRYHIDGARIDMAHALPVPLGKELVRAAKEADPDFLFWSEEFSPGNAQKAKKEGYHLILGDVWSAWKTVSPVLLGQSLAASVEAALPVVAAAELSDSPRGPVMTGSQEKANAAFLLAALLPNAYLLINNGQECGERQPMNLGLLNDEAGRFVLPKDDPMYGKLAFFDRVCFHWASESKAFDWIKQVTALRRACSPLLHKPGAFRPDLLRKPGPLVRLAYQDEERVLCALFSFAEEAQTVSLRDEFGPLAACLSFEHPVLSQGVCEENGGLLSLSPGGCMVFIRGQST